MQLQWWWWWWWSNWRSNKLELDLELDWGLLFCFLFIEVNNSPSRPERKFTWVFFSPLCKKSISNEKKKSASNLFHNFELLTFFSFSVFLRILLLTKQFIPFLGSSSTFSLFSFSFFFARRTYIIIIILSKLFRILYEYVTRDSCVCVPPPLPSTLCSSNWLYFSVAIKYVYDLGISPHNEWKAVSPHPHTYEKLFAKISV